MTQTATPAIVREQRLRSAGLAAGAVAGCALVALVDPHDGGYPICPTRALLGFDCPVCGTLRGTNSLLRGRITEALDHNLLLVLAVPVALVAWMGWVRTALGSRPRRRTVPGWVVPVVATVAIAFAVARNLPFDGLSWLASDA